MGERYWISGAQIGMITAFLEPSEISLPYRLRELHKILDEIQEKQFIGNRKTLEKMMKK